MRKKTNSGLKKVLMIYGGVLLVLIATCVIVYIVYNNKIKESAKQSLLAAEKLTELVPNTGALEEASTEISKTINEVLEETASEINQNSEDENTQENNQDESTEPQEPVVEPEPVKELEFAYPVNGEISKPFSIDNLVFSETLQEWVVHKGIDIKAPRTTVVKSAEEVEREVCKLKKAEYMRRRIGEVHEGIISGVTNWGIYVELPNTIEGMVHVSILPGDYYYYDEKTYSMVGERTGRTFKLGEKATIRVKDVDMMLKNIDFELVEDDDYEQSEDGWN